MLKLHRLCLLPDEGANVLVVSSSFCCLSFVSNLTLLRFVARAFMPMGKNYRLYGVNCENE